MALHPQPGTNAYSNFILSDLEQHHAPKEAPFWVGVAHASGADGIEARSENFIFPGSASLADRRGRPIQQKIIDAVTEAAQPRLSEGVKTLGVRLRTYIWKDPDGFLTERPWNQAEETYTGNPTLTPHMPKLTKR